MTITMTKEALIEKLTERLAAAKAEDEKVEKAHKVDEQSALIKFRSQLREALKWDYKKAKEELARRYNGIKIDSPSCPNRHATAINAELYVVKLSTSKQFQIKPGTDIHRAITWVPPSQVSKTVCD